MKENKDYKIHYKNFENLKMNGVYLIRNLDNNTLKIGITDNLPRRYKEIIKTFNFCGSIPNLKIECYIEYNSNLQLEQFLHEELKEFNYQNEWFNINDIKIILEKVDKFQHIEINEEIELNENNNTILEDRYYLYNDYISKKNIYIKCYQENLSAILILDDIHNKIYNDFSYYSCSYNSESENCNKIILSEDIKQLFNKYDTYALIEIEPNKYISLESYLLEEYKNNVLYVFKKIKENTINKLNTIDICNSINIIEDIEQTCISIQKDLNNCIKYKNRQNYKPY